MVCADHVCILVAFPCRATITAMSPAGEGAQPMDTLTLLIIIIVVVLLLGGGGFWYRGRR